MHGSAADRGTPRHEATDGPPGICEKGGLTLSSAALLLALHIGPAPWAPGGPSRAEDLVISLATIGPGDGVEAMGGHAALAIVDTRLEQGRLYNFGVVEFSPD